MMVSKFQRKCKICGEVVRRKNNRAIYCVECAKAWAKKRGGS